ncbi:MAG: peptidoglycan-binding domain-containing protein [Patescibacteria group bacterium]
MSNLSRKVVAVGLSLTTAAWFAGSVIPAFAQTSQSTIDQLMAQIAALTAQITALQSGSASVPASSSFTKNLTLGSKGTDVSALQQILINGGYLTAVSAPTAYFGSATKAALAKWQASKGITPSVGYFGAKSRAAIGGSVVVTPPGGTPAVPVVTVPAGTDLVVSLASDSPASRTIGSGTAFNSALKVNLTAGSKAVNVTGVTLKKTGFVANTNLNGVDVVDASGVRHGNVVTSINSDNTIGLTFPSAPIAVAAGQSTSFTVRFNLLSGNLNGNVGFSIDAASAITGNTTAISGSFPISGNLMTIVNGGSSLASTTLDVLTGTGSSTLSVDAVSAQEITKFRIQETSSNEAVNIYSVMLYNNGSGADSDVKDVQLLNQAGAVLATAQQVGKYVTFTLATPFFIDKGQTKDFTVKAKIVDGAARTINYVVYNNYDLDLRGSGTGVSVIPGVGTNDTTFPIGNGFNIQTIGSGSLTQIKASDSPSSAVVPGSTNVSLAKYTVKPIGENYELRAVKFWVTSSSGVRNLNGTFYVKVNGATVYSAAASSISVTTATEYSLSSYPVLTAGVDSFITIEGSINSTATASDNYQVKDFQVTSAKRLTTNDLITNPTSATDANSISVKAAALSVTTLSTPVANSIVAGTTQYEYATIKLDASTGGEDVKISKIVVSSDGALLTEVQNLYLYKDSDTSPLTTTASTASNAATVSFDFSTPFTVGKTTPVTLHFKADASSGTGTHTFKVASSTSAVTAVGAVTGNTLTNGSDITFSGSGQGQAHVAAGRLVLSDAAGAPNTTTTVTVGSTGQVVFAFQLASQYETQKITALTVYATSSINKLATTTISNVKFYADGTYFATAEPRCLNVGTVSSSTSCTYTVTASDNLLAAPVPVSGTTITVKADIGAGGSARLGDFFRFVMTSSTADISVKGSNTGSTAATKTGVPATAGNYVVTPQQVVITGVSPAAGAVTTCGSTAAASCGANNTLGILKIANNGSKTIRLSTSTSFVFSESGASTSTYDLYISSQDGSQSDSSQILSAGSVAISGGVVTFDISTSTAANRQITGNGGYRYLTIKNHETSAGGTRWNFSVNRLGTLLYQADNSQLGYDSDPYESTVTPTDLTGIAQALFVDGKPSLGTINTGY